MEVGAVAEAHHAGPQGIAATPAGFLLIVDHEIDDMVVVSPRGLKRTAGSAVFFGQKGEQLL